MLKESNTLEIIYYRNARAMNYNWSALRMIYQINGIHFRNDLLKEKSTCI